MRTRQLSDLRADAYKLADLENATALVPAADVTELLNQGWTRVYALLCRTGEDYYLAQPWPTFTTVSGQDTYYATGSPIAPAGTALLPTDMWRLRGVDVQIQTGRWQNATRYENEQRNDYQSTDWTWPMQPLYSFQGSGANTALRFIPPPAAASPIRLLYYPAAVRLVADGDLLDGGNGWELYPVAWAAKRMALKDENYELVAALNGELAQLEADIQREAANRNAGIAPKMRRVRYKRQGAFGGAGRF